jgi:dTDP-4-dehydrorhamnose reductase
LKVLVVGAAGMLGHDVLRAGERAGHELVPIDLPDIDITDTASIEGVLAGVVPDAVLNCAAWTDVDGQEADRQRALAVNANGAGNLARAAAATQTPLLHVSTDYVFDGTAAAPYTEWDEPRPRSVYGRSKLGGEREALALVPETTVVRTSWVCGPHGSNMVKTVLRLLRAGAPLRFVDDQRGCPTFTPDLASMIVRLGTGRRPGIFHVTNQGATTWYGFARDVVAAAGADPDRVEPIATADLDPPRPAPRPANSVLDNAALRLGGVALLDAYQVPLQRTVSGLVG